MKGFAALILLGLLAGTAVAADTGRSMLQAYASCTSIGTLKIRVQHGTCKGWIRADCRAHAAAQEKIKKRVEAAFTYDLCKPAEVKVHALAIAKAIAQVYVSAIAKVSCDKKGFGCGFALASGEAWAQSFAKAAVQAVTGAWNGDLEAICIADIEAIAVAIADAAADAQSSACVYGKGSAANFSKAFAESVSIAIAEAFVTSTAEVCKKPKLKVNSVCHIDGYGSSKHKKKETTNKQSKPFERGSGKADGSARAKTVAKKLSMCVRKSMECCFDQSKCGDWNVKSWGPPKIMEHKWNRDLCFCPHFPGYQG